MVAYPSERETDYDNQKPFTQTRSRSLRDRDLFSAPVFNFSLAETSSTGSSWATVANVPVFEPRWLAEGTWYLAVWLFSKCSSGVNINWRVSNGTNDGTTVGITETSYPSTPQGPSIVEWVTPSAALLRSFTIQIEQGGNSNTLDVKNDLGYPLARWQHQSS